MGIQLGGLIGLISGIIFGAAGWYFGRKEAEKSRGLDELYKHIWQKARSISWYATLVTIYILLLFALFGYMTTVVKSLSILLVVHLFSWATSGAYLTMTMYAHSKADRQIHFILIIFFITLGVGFIVTTLFFL